VSKEQNKIHIRRMKMKKSIIAIFAILSFIFSVSGITKAQNNNVPNPNNPNSFNNGRMMMKGAGWNHPTLLRNAINKKADFLKKLNLTDEQKEKIAALKIDFQKKMVDLRADLQKNKLDLKELRLKSDLNRDAVIAAVEKIDKSKDAISVATANHLLDIYQVLTPEQQKMVREHFFSQMDGRRQGRMMMRRQM
jgi:Spy/CpxP family protein refolding chaperone